MSHALWFWQAPYVAFYEVWGAPDSALLRHWVAPLNKTSTPGSEGRGWELGVAGSDESIEDCGLRGLPLSYSTMVGASRRPNL